MCKLKKKEKKGGGQRLHVMEGIGEHDIYCKPKFNKLKFLGKLVFQHKKCSVAFCLTNLNL